MNSFRSAHAVARGALLSLCLALPAHAIRDADGDGMSDVWEAQFGFSITDNGTLNPTQAPGADFDKDGRSNLLEAIAGTDPKSAAMPAGYFAATITPGLSTSTVSWPTLVGKEYTLLVSTDLTSASWTPVGIPVVGTGTTEQAIVSPGGPRKFWRVRVTDIDTDGDGLTNHEEHVLGSNPNQTDTDLDGVPDGTDPTPTVNNAVTDPDGAAFDTTAAINTNLLARWDCETITDFTGGVFGFTDVTGNGYNAQTIGSILTLDPLGMISKAAAFDATGDYLWAPPQLVANRGSFTVSMWFKFKKDYIQTKAGSIQTVLMAYNGVNDATPDFQIHVGKAASAIAPQSLSFSHYNASNVLVFQQVNPIQPANWLDNGKWRHLVMVKSAGNVRLYLDGVALGSNVVVPSSWTGTTAGYVCFGKLVAVAGGSDTAFRGSLDRMRFYSRALTAGDVTTLYNQNSDRDSRSDLAEVNTRVWTDANGNGIPEPAEITYTNSPFIWGP